MNLRRVNAARYVAPLREGGSLPAIVEADDGWKYIVKFRGAGQGPLALVAEIVAGEIARFLGLRVPEIVLVEIDPVFGRSEPDAEIRHLLKASAGLNVGLKYLPGATTFDPAAGDHVSADEASLLVWFDAYAMNVDRTARNANLMLWEKELWLIDHGASLYFHHNWESARDKARSRFQMIRQHILLGSVGDLAQPSKLGHERLNAESLTSILALVPDAWLVSERDDVTAVQRRANYLELLLERLAHSTIFEEEIHDARNDV
jgi:hypothetical protein